MKITDPDFKNLVLDMENKIDAIIKYLYPNQRIAHNGALSYFNEVNVEGHKINIDNFLVTGYPESITYNSHHITINTQQYSTRCQDYNYGIFYIKWEDLDKPLEYFIEYLKQCYINRYMGEYKEVCENIIKVKEQKLLDEEKKIREEQEALLKLYEKYPDTIIDVIRSR